MFGLLDAATVWRRRLGRGLVSRLISAPTTVLAAPLEEARPASSYAQLVNFFARLARLWRRPLFRQIVTLRLFTQGGDTALQVAMASYLLLNPQTQPDGLSIALAMTVLVLPFSLVGPFISPILDRFSRRQIVLWSDICRVLLAVSMGGLVLAGQTSGVGQIVLFGLLLVALSINRLQLAALAAGLPLAIEGDEYVEAMSVMPMIGPAAAVLAGGLGGGVRLALANRWPSHQADALVFAIAALLFGCGLLVVGRLDRDQLGPEVVVKTQLRTVWLGIRTAIAGLRDRPVAAQGIWIQMLTRLSWGALTVLAALVFRLHFNTGNLTSAALGLGAWFAISGVGFALSGVAAGPLISRMGLRRGLLTLLVSSAALQFVPMVWLTPLAMIVSGFGLGLTVQSIKICCDTLVQAHLDDDLRGRVMVGYDIANNLGLAGGALLAGALLPTDGASRLGLLIIAMWYLVVAVISFVVSNPHREAYETGTAGRPVAS